MQTPGAANYLFHRSVDVDNLLHNLFHNLLHNLLHGYLDHLCDSFLHNLITAHPVLHTQPNFHTTSPKPVLLYMKKEAAGM